jgi:hypothetical protein
MNPTINIPTLFFQQIAMVTKKTPSIPLRKKVTQEEYEELLSEEGIMRMD